MVALDGSPLREVLCSFWSHTSPVHLPGALQQFAAVNERIRYLTKDPEMKLSQLLGLAMQHQQAGNLSQAEAICRDILRVEPRNPHALHLLGVVAYQFGQHELAIDLIRSSLREMPTLAAAHRHLALRFKQLDAWRRRQLVIGKPFKFSLTMPMRTPIWAVSF